MAPGCRTKAGSDGRAQLIKKADSDSVKSTTIKWWQNGARLIQTDGCDFQSWQLN